MYRNGKGPLQLVIAFEPFMKWALDCMCPIKPPTHYTRNQYIIAAIDYRKKWVEVKALCDLIQQGVLLYFFTKILSPSSVGPHTLGY